MILLRGNPAMPLYVYRAVEDGCGECAEGWEELQNADDPPLEKCPHCGAEVRKVLSAFSAGKGDLLSNSNLKDHGFQKLKRTGEGGYRREV